MRYVRICESRPISERSRISGPARYSCWHSASRRSRFSMSGGTPETSPSLRWYRKPDSEGAAEASAADASRLATSERDQAQKRQSPRVPGASSGGAGNRIPVFGRSMGSRMAHLGTPWALAMAHERPSRAHVAHKLWARGRSENADGGYAPFGARSGWRPQQPWRSSLSSPRARSSGDVEGSGVVGASLSGVVLNEAMMRWHIAAGLHSSVLRILSISCRIMDEQLIGSRGGLSSSDPCSSPSARVARPSGPAFFKLSTSRRRVVVTCEPASPPAHASEAAEAGEEHDGHEDEPDERQDPPVSGARRSPVTTPRHGTFLLPPSHLRGERVRLLRGRTAARKRYGSSTCRGRAKRARAWESRRTRSARRARRYRRAPGRPSEPGALDVAGSCGSE